MITHRERQILAVIDRLGQVSSAHLDELVFHDVSTTRRKLVLQRMRRNRLIALVERRRMGGEHGGSGQHVYELAQEGLKLVGARRRYVRHALDYHKLAIADVVVSLRRAEREGLLGVEYLENEPDCWVAFDGGRLEPDLHAIIKTARGRLPLWVEVDLGTERQRHVKEKLQRYAVAEDRLGDSWEVMPLIVWLTPDNARTREIRHMIAAGSSDKHGLFQVYEMSRFPQVYLA